VVNVCKGKQLTNMRASGSDENINLTQHIKMSLLHFGDEIGVPSLSSIFIRQAERKNIKNLKYLYDKFSKTFRFPLIDSIGGTILRQSLNFISDDEIKKANVELVNVVSYLCDLCREENVDLHVKYKETDFTCIQVFINNSASRGRIGAFEYFFDSYVTEENKVDIASIALRQAVISNEPGTAEAALKRKGDPNKPISEQGATLLMWLAQIGGSSNMADLLITHGANVSTTCKVMVSVLLNHATANIVGPAAHGQSLENFIKRKNGGLLPEFLLGFNALHLAVFFDNLPIIRTLEQKINFSKKANNIATWELASIMHSRPTFTEILDLNPPNISDIIRDRILCVVLDDGLEELNFMFQALDKKYHSHRFHSHPSIVQFLITPIIICSTKEATKKLINALSRYFDKIVCREIYKEALITTINNNDFENFEALVQSLICVNANYFATTSMEVIYQFLPFLNDALLHFKLCAQLTVVENRFSKNPMIDLPPNFINDVKMELGNLKKDFSSALAPLAIYFSGAIKKLFSIYTEKHYLIAHMLISLENMPLQLSKKIDAILSHSGFEDFMRKETKLVEVLNEIKKRVHVMAALAPASSAASVAVLASSSVSSSAAAASSSSSSAVAASAPLTVDEEQKFSPRNKY